MSDPNAGVHALRSLVSRIDLGALTALTGPEGVANALPRSYQDRVQAAEDVMGHLEGWAREAERPGDGREWEGMAEASAVASRRACVEQGIIRALGGPSDAAVAAAESIGADLAWVYEDECWLREERWGEFMLLIGLAMGAALTEDDRLRIGHGDFEMISAVLAATRLMDEAAEERQAAFP